MNEFNNGEPTTSWSIYSSSSNGTRDQKEGLWKNFDTSMNAISFGFVATAILISMFIIMAIFEHLFRPTVSDHNDSSRIESARIQKLGSPELVQRSYTSDFSVVILAGQQHPTYIAQPAPLPCEREGVYWPPHQHIYST
ncbi:hypothetical protein CDL12_19864 [Handroanthus impetiginosus]|uniref:Uncharacterized protein n=1 Tax=Handroanthus impetiginosus TaxID=429701 RepID=A0A2G9GQM2_9LAMI|nr:hypothetical protein CDL12_19864 [Handroanthus impetiginosus]